MHACLLLPFPPSVNNLFVNNRRTGGRFPAGKYKAWQEEAARALACQMPLPEFKGKVSLTFSFGRPDRRARDIFNLIKGPEDMLVRMRVIEDDSLVEFGKVQWVSDVVGCRIEIESVAA